MCLTDPADVARVESKTVISTQRQRDTVPVTAEGVQGKLGKWLSPSDMEAAYQARFPGSMKGKFYCFLNLVSKLLMKQILQISLSRGGIIVLKIMG